MALSDLNLSHNRLRTLQNRTNGLFEDCLSIRKVEILSFVKFAGAAELGPQGAHLRALRT